jgi:predicted metalloprotease
MCGMELYRQPNAFFCYPERLMAWDRGVFVPTGERFFGPMSVVALIAHEYGHAVQKMAGLTNRRTATIVAEQQADCLSGVYLRWVAEGNSPRFTLSTDAGLNHVLAGAIAIRDPVWTEDHTEMLDHGHGTAVDRIAAFQMGFVAGATACAAIDIDDVDKRRGELPMYLDDENGPRQTREAPLSAETLNTLTEALGKVFNPQEAPTLSLNPPACLDAQATPPAFYCPATNTIGVNLPVLKKMGIAANEADDEVLIQGDNTAVSIVTSRYAQAVQHERGLVLDNAVTALRTACLTGSAQRDMVCSPTAGSPATSTVIRCRPGSAESWRFDPDCATASSAATSGSRDLASAASVELRHGSP